MQLKGLQWRRAKINKLSNGCLEESVFVTVAPLSCAPHLHLSLIQLGTGQSDTKFELRNRMQTLEPKQKGAAGESYMDKSAELRSRAGMSAQELRTFLSIPEIDDKIKEAERIQQRLDELVNCVNCALEGT